MAVQSTSRMTNGVNIDALEETLTAFRQTPGAARFRFHTTSRWLGGGHTRTRIHGFRGAGQDRTHQRVFHVEADTPSVILGTDLAPDALEYVLAALAACLTNAVVFQAALRRIRLERLEVAIAGEVDLRGAFGVSDEVCAGYGELAVELTVATDATDAQLAELIGSARRSSSVLDMLARSVPVRVETVRGGAGDSESTNRTEHGRGLQVRGLAVRSDNGPEKKGGLS